MDKSSKQYTKWLILYILFIIVVSLLINLLLYLPIPSAGNVDAPDWLGFWGSFLGSMIACIPAFFALDESRRQAKQQHNEVQEQLTESRRQAEQMHFETLESRRCSVMPIVDLIIFPIYEYPDENDLPNYWALIDDKEGVNQAVSSNHFTREMYKSSPGNFYSFHIKNIGLGTALDAQITAGDVIFFGGDVATSFDWNSIFRITSDNANAKEPLKQFDFKIRYHDVFSNLYERECSVRLGSMSISVLRATPPKLIERCETPPC